MRNITLALLFVALFSNCTRRLAGNGNFINETRTPGKFTSIETDGAFNVVLTNDESEGIQIQAESNILPEIATDVQGGALIIGYTNGLTEFEHGDVLIKVPVRGLESVSLAGSGSIVATDTMRGDKLEASLLGSGKIQLLVSGDAITTILSGAGEVFLKGRVNSHKVNISGSGEVHAYDLSTSITNVNISGSGDAELNAIQILEAAIAGSGDVRYTGTPAVTSTVTGSGKVKPR